MQHLPDGFGLIHASLDVGPERMNASLPIVLSAFGFSGMACGAAGPFGADMTHDGDTGSQSRRDAGSIDAELLRPDISGTLPGRLLGSRFVTDVSAETLRSVVLPGAVVENGYALYELDVLTSGRVARVTVTVPADIERPHAILHAVGTTGVADACGVVGTEWGAGLAGLYGARGQVGMALDYPGLGTEGDHAYLVGRVSGQAVLDALSAFTEFAEQRGIEWSGRSAVTGLSQGGHAALWAARLHPQHAPELDLRAVAVVGPASVWLEHWQPGLTFEGNHLVYHALLVWAWSRHYRATGPSPWAEAIAPNIDAWMTSLCAFPPPQAPEQTLQDRLPRRPSAVFSSEFLQAFTSGDWGPYDFMARGFSESRVGGFGGDLPVLVYQGDADVVVPELGTRALVAELEQAGVDVTYRVVPGGTHDDIAFGFLAFPQLRTESALAWVEEQLAAP